MRADFDGGVVGEEDVVFGPGDTTIAWVSPSSDTDVVYAREVWGEGGVVDTVPVDAAVWAVHVARIVVGCIRVVMVRICMGMRRRRG